MTRRYDCGDPALRDRALADAAEAVCAGELVVLPTDTVYGIGCDAFRSSAVGALLEAKGRGREMPAPILIGSLSVLDSLVADMGPYGAALIEEFWPGAVTMVFPAAGRVATGLGDARGTIAVRMPENELALDLLAATGPMAVSSANRSGSAAARSMSEAYAQLGASVSVYLDGGPSPMGEPSTILDLSEEEPRLLRAGAVSIENLRKVCGAVTG